MLLPLSALTIGAALVEMAEKSERASTVTNPVARKTCRAARSPYLFAVRGSIGFSPCAGFSPFTTPINFARHPQVIPGI